MPLIHYPIGSSPYGESCAQVGTEGYFERAQAECRAFTGQLRRHYQAAHGGKLPPCRLEIKGNRHDFGTYYEVVATFDARDRKAEEAASWFDGNTPELWDDQARQELPLPRLPFEENGA